VRTYRVTYRLQRRAGLDAFTEIILDAAHGDEAVERSRAPAERQLAWLRRPDEAVHLESLTVWAPPVPASPREAA
jgi:hypothetical protein